MEKSHRYVKTYALCVVIVASMLTRVASARVDVWLYDSMLISRGGKHYFYPGDQFISYVRVENIGDEASDDVTVDLFVVGPAERRYLLGSVTYSGLAPGQSSQIGVVCTVPLDIPGGSYSRFEGRLTCSNDANLSNNNLRVTNILPVVIPFPNLAILAVDVQGSCYRPGEPVAVIVTMKNIGTARAASYCIECYATANGAQMTSGCYLGCGGGTTVDPDETAITTTEYHLPDEMAEGEYVIWARALCTDDTNPANNIGKARSVQVGPFPDLAVQLVDVTDGAYTPGEQITVQSVIQNIGDRTSDSYTIQYYLSKDIYVTMDDIEIASVAGVGLAPGQHAEDIATCQLPLYFREETAYIGARIVCTSECNCHNDVGVDTMPIRVSVEHLVGYVSGRVTYKDLQDWTHPVRYARVRLHDVNETSAQVGERIIGESYTDQDGNYSVLIPMDDNRIQQIRVRVFAEAAKGAYPGTTSGICCVKDDVNHELYALKSEPYPRPQDGPLTVNMTAPNTGGEFMVFDSAIEGFHKARTFFGLEPNEIVAYWPSADNGTYYDPNSGIHIASGDRGDRDVILHEYGHYVAEVCKFALGEVGDDPQHYWDRDLRFSPSNRTVEQARHLAFREAWATLFSIATQYGDTWYPYSGSATYDDYDEKSKYRYLIDLEYETRKRVDKGEFFENMNTAALWDVFDDANDSGDALSDPSLSRIWRVMYDDRPADIKGFWDRWMAEFACVGDMMRVFYNHGMPLQYAGAPTAIEGFESGDFKTYPWQHPGLISWTVAADGARQGAFCARSGKVEDTGATWLEIKTQVDNGWMSFWTKLSCRYTAKLCFSIDGNQRSQVSGANDWAPFSFFVLRGTHTFTWMYAKISPYAEGEDAAWIDDIVFPMPQEGGTDP